MFDVSLVLLECNNNCMIMSSHEMWRHTLVILSNVECARIGWSDVQTPPTTTPKLQLDFLDLKSSWSLGVVVGGGGLVPDTPPPPPLNYNLTL